MRWVWMDLRRADCSSNRNAGSHYAKSSSHKQLKAVWGDLQGGCAPLAKPAISATWQTRQMVTAPRQSHKIGAHWGGLGGRPSCWIAGWSALLLCLLLLPLLLPLLVVGNGLLHNCWLAAKPAGPEGGAWRLCVQRRRRTLGQQSHTRPHSAKTSTLGSGTQSSIPGETGSGDIPTNSRPAGLVRWQMIARLMQTRTFTGAWQISAWCYARTRSNSAVSRRHE